MADLRSKGTFAALPVGAKISILVAILAVLSAGYYLGIHMSIDDQIAGAQAKNTRLKATLKEAQERQQKYLNLREELAGREALDKQNLRVLPDDPEIPAFLGDLNRLAELSGLRMQRVQPEPEVTEEFYIKIPVQLKLTGKYHQIAKFFYNTSRLERAVNMENVKLNKPRQEGEDIVLDAEVLATTFRRKEAQPDKKVAAAPAAKKKGR